MTKDALIRASRTALWSFIGLFGLSVIGFLQQIVEWANAGGAAAFPSVSVLGFAAISAAVSAVIGLVSFVANAAEDARGSDGILHAKARPLAQPKAGGGYPMPPEV